MPNVLTSPQDYPDMARIAGQRALEDAGIKYDAVEQVGPSPARI